MAPTPSYRYTALLDRIHCQLLPRTYVEVGVADGRSLALALPGTACVGIDPAPGITFPVDPTAKIFPLASDEFFDRHDLRAELGARDVDLAFIDGMHLFEFALRDFIALEGACHPAATVLVHDCYPVDARTSAREREGGRGTWSGDIWKLILVLREYRPDLAVATVDVPPTGLGVITGLDPSSNVLARHYDDIVERFTGRPYADLAADKSGRLNRVPDDWHVVRSLLPARRFRTERPSLLLAKRAARWRPGRRPTIHREVRQLLALGGLDPLVAAAERSAARVRARSARRPTNALRPL